jgi:hypothetical protein
LNLVPSDQEAAGRNRTLLILSGKDFEFLSTKHLKKLAILLLRMKEIADAPVMPPAWPDWNVFFSFSNRGKSELNPSFL